MDYQVWGKSAANQNWEMPGTGKAQGALPDLSFPRRRLLSGIPACEQRRLSGGHLSEGLSSSSIESGFDTRALEQGEAQLGEQDPQAARVALCLVVQGQQQVGDQRGEDLDVDGMRTAPQEVAQAQVLLDPLEEQLDPPALFVMLGDLRGGAVQIVGGQHQGAVVLGAGHGHAAQGLLVGVLSPSARMPVGKAHDLIGEDRLGVRGGDG